MTSYGSDLNPVAVMITKAMIEIPPQFAGCNPIGPTHPREQRRMDGMGWPGAKGLAEDVRRYGHWMREQALQKIGHLYPKVKVTQDMVKERPDLKPYAEKELTVIAWLWAKTVKSPHPAYRDVAVPLASTFILCPKEGKEAYIEPIVEGKVLLLCD